MTESHKAIYDSLVKKYGKQTLNKKELAAELGYSVAAINKKIEDGRDLPNYKKTGEHKSATVIFPIFEVAAYLSAGNIKTA